MAGKPRAFVKRVMESHRHKKGGASPHKMASLLPTPEQKWLSEVIKTRFPKEQEALNAHLRKHRGRRVGMVLWQDEEANYKQWLAGFFSRHPKVHRQYLRRKQELAQAGKRPAAHTWKNRYGALNRALWEVIGREGLSPKSFLDAGAGLSPDQKDRVSPAQSTLDAKAFFEGKGLRDMRFVATDIVPVKREVRDALAKKGVLAYTQDYTKRPPARKFDIIMLGNVSQHMEAPAFRATVENLFDALCPGGLLAISNRVTTMGAHGIPGAYDEEGIYRKVREGKGYTLERVHYRSENVGFE